MARRTVESWKSSGIRRLLSAPRYQLEGIRHGLRNDPAIRQVSIVVFVLCLLALFLPVARIEKLLLILPLLLVALVEYLNSAIEAVVDRVSPDHHPLSKVAKDYASVAVGIAVVMSLASWAAILLPRVQQLIEGWNGA
jgi:diacylglycerol kinase (ATP)